MNAADHGDLVDDAAPGMTDSQPAGSAGPSEQGLVAVGRIGKAHGIRGDVFVEPWTDSPEDRFFDGAVLATDPTDRGPLTVENSRLHSGKLVVHFEGFDTRNSVEAIRGTMLVMSAQDRPPIEDPDEFYDTDLIGLQTRLVSGEPIGPVVDVLHSAADSLLVITAQDGREVLVPFRREFVPVVDLTARIVELDPPDGLFDL
jgi:16S rRNA processing protein RimM